MRGPAPSLADGHNKGQHPVPFLRPIAANNQTQQSTLDVDIGLKASCFFADSLQNRICLTFFCCRMMKGTRSTSFFAICADNNTHDDCLRAAKTLTSLLGCHFSTQRVSSAEIICRVPLADSLNLKWNAFLKTQSSGLL